MRLLAGFVAMCALAGCRGGDIVFGDASNASDASHANVADASAPAPVEPLPPLPPGWELVAARQIGSPVTNPSGVAFDGSQLWLLGSGPSPMSHELVRYDDVNLVVTRQFTLDLGEALGSGAYGIAWDGHYIWISVSGNTNELLAVDPDTGAIAKTWASPTTLGPSSLSFDATSMWIGDGTGRVYSMDLASGAITSSFYVSDAFVRDNGIAARTGQVLVNGLFSEGFALFDTTMGALLDQGSTVLGPMCFARDQLVWLASGQIVYNDIQ